MHLPRTQHHTRSLFYRRQGRRVGACMGLCRPLGPRQLLSQRFTGGMEPYPEKHLPQPLTRNGQDLASLHHTFTQYCLWLETQDTAVGAEHVPKSFSSPPTPPKRHSQNSSYSNSENHFGPIFDADELDTFTPFSSAPATSHDATSKLASLDQDDAMQDLMFDDFVADTSDSFSGFVPEFRDLYAVLPKSSISEDHMQWTAENQVCLSEKFCCFAQARRTLESLHITSTSCLSTVGKGASINRPGLNAPRNAGSVFTGNREAMLSLSRMLRCSCSSKIQLQLVMAIICNKLVTWYHAMVHEDERLAFASSKMYPKLRGSTYGSGKERVLCQPITIGDYCLGGTIEAQITGRLVLAHLKGMEFLIVVLARRIKDVSLKYSSHHGGDQHSSSSDNEGELLEEVSDGLVSYLTGQLQAAREEVGRLMGE